MYGWKQRYFILDNGILSYKEGKDSNDKGKIYLKIS